MTHKEKCSVLKRMRKTIADKLGIDLHQTECTYQGECSGTCPKCAHEESVLNKAILGGAIVASSVMLCACDLGTVSIEGGGKNVKEDDNGGGKDYSGDIQVVGEEEADPDLIVDGEEEAPPVVDYDDDEMAGDVVLKSYTYDELCKAAANMTGAPICDVDHENEDGTITIHCYEVVNNGDESHTATFDWITVDIYTGIGSNFMGDEVDLTEYMY